MRSAICGVQNTECKIQNSEYGMTTPEFELLAPNSKGFTLIEIVITIVLVSILSGLAAVIILQGVKAYSAEQIRSDVHYQAKLAVERMAREIRTIRSATAADITTMTATNLQFNNISGNNIQFQRSGASAPYTLLRNADVLATHVQSMTLSYFANDGTTVVTSGTVANLWFVVIDVTDQQGSDSLQIRTRVHPRNF